MSDELKSTSSNAPDDSEELAHYDDAIIGRAFRWSALVAVFLVTCGAALYFIWHRKPAVPPSRLAEVVAPEKLSPPTTEIPATRFIDITASSGITFTHVNGAYGEKLLPETMGGGVAFFDYDN